MAVRIWIAASLTTIALVACVEAAALAPAREQTSVLVPAAQSNPAVLRDLTATNSQVGDTIIPYEGIQSLETTILESDVIARVSYLGNRISVVEHPTTPDYGLILLEFRFRVHEYLKGTGPDEIGASVYLWFYSEWQAAATEIAQGHDSRWDDREAIVFLRLPDPDHFGWALPTTPGHYLFGPMVDITHPNGIREAYTVASPHRRLWLPAAQPSGASWLSCVRSSRERLFLLDASATTTADTIATLPSISQTSLKSRITFLEAEANAGGTPEYRECVEESYRSENYLREELRLYGSSLPFRRLTSTIGSGLPAGTIPYDQPYDRMYSVESKDDVGIRWFEGPDKDLVSSVDVDFRLRDSGGFQFSRQVATTRPLPAGEYTAYINDMSPLEMVCARYPEIARKYEMLVLTVTPPRRVLHEAFFDPVTIGNAVGADSKNGVLEPAEFRFRGIRTEITSLKWESGTVTMALSRNIHLRLYVVDFITLDGSVSLTLLIDDATRSGEDLSWKSSQTLSWRVDRQPWNAGDLLMLRIRGRGPVVVQ